ncbi:diguanylate cyclase [Bacillus sp. T33-2]|uniref:diguanylate cyclase n=1 Tax=Bacillus sp. T33-2 TaxID=2054168 RepID=UPI000C7680D4|nr:diguanylate cyclase [Bacillus sp. T33-2]PLR97699.1 hypothetical protein CVD19_09545 [Bacillus sp. T33-2]
MVFIISLQINVCSKARYYFNMIVLQDFFVNFCILCTGIFLIDLLCNNHKKYLKTKIYRNLHGGMLHGLFGVLLMQFGINLQNGLLIDLRVIPMMIAAYIGGWVSVVTSATILIIARFALYPVTISSFTNIVVLSISAIAFAVICASKMKSEKKWFFMVISFLIPLGLVFHLVIPEVGKAVIIFIQYGVAVGCGTYGAYVLKSYLMRNRHNYEMQRKFAERDYLTGLCNVRTFNNCINSLHMKAAESNDPLSLLVLDIDHFKKINDTYGHPAGDKVLKHISQLLLLLCRSVDVVSRNGGEEFSVIMPASDEHSARAVAERLRQAVEQTDFRINGDTHLKITISIGYATANKDNPLTVNELIRQADQALYSAKQKGRNCVIGHHMDLLDVIV